MLWDRETEAARAKSGKVGPGRGGVTKRFVSSRGIAECDSYPFIITSLLFPPLSTRYAFPDAPLYLS